MCVSTVTACLTFRGKTQITCSDANWTGVKPEDGGGGPGLAVQWRGCSLWSCCVSFEASTDTPINNSTWGQRLGASTGANYLIFYSVSKG